MNGFSDILNAIMKEVLNKPIIIDIDELVERTPQVVKKFTEP